jgi:alpha-galactosidase
MGWNTYYGVHGFDEATILDVAQAMLARGLRHAGYRYVWLDSGWWNGARTPDGQLVVDPQRWPHGMPWLTRWLHAHRLLAGIYTDAGQTGCSGHDTGSYGHYGQDADTFAAWGFDAVKMDFCGGAAMRLPPAAVYSDFARALRTNRSGRPILLNVCNFLRPGALDGSLPPDNQSVFTSWSFGQYIANSWRTDTDLGSPGDVQFRDVLRNLDSNAAHPTAARPGHWNDPDYLAPQLGMTDGEAQAQFSMWAIVAAPLMLGNDPRTMTPATQAMVTNSEAIAIDQDRAGIQGTLIGRSGLEDVWVKPLADGDRAVALLNRSPVPLPITTTAASVGLPGSRGYWVRDVWQHRTTTTRGTIGATVPPHGVVLYRVSPKLAPAHRHHRHRAAGRTKRPARRTHRV